MEHVAYMRELRNAHSILDEKSEGCLRMWTEFIWLGL